MTTSVELIQKRNSSSSSSNPPPPFLLQLPQEIEGGRLIGFLKSTRPSSGIRALSLAPRAVEVELDPRFSSNVVCLDGIRRKLHHQPFFGSMPRRDGARWSLCAPGLPLRMVQSSFTFTDLVALVSTPAPFGSDPLLQTLSSAWDDGERILSFEIAWSTNSSILSTALVQLQVALLDPLTPTRGVYSTLDVAGARAISFVSTMSMSLLQRITVPAVQSVKPGSLASLTGGWLTFSGSQFSNISEALNITMATDANPTNAFYCAPMRIVDSATVLCFVPSSALRQAHLVAVSVTMYQQQMHLLDIRIDVDECDNINTCGSLSVCTNMAFLSPTCTCAAGYFSPTGVNCQPCAVDTYRSDLAASSCTSCPLGSSTGGATGSASLSLCVCKAPQYTGDAGVGAGCQPAASDSLLNAFVLSPASTFTPPFDPLGSVSTYTVHVNNSVSLSTSVSLRISPHGSGSTVAFISPASIAGAAAAAGAPLAAVISVGNDAELSVSVRVTAANGDTALTTLVFVAGCGSLGCESATGSAAEDHGSSTGEGASSSSSSSLGASVLAALSSSLGSLGAGFLTAVGWFWRRSVLQHRRQTICRLASVVFENLPIVYASDFTTEEGKKFVHAIRVLAEKVRKEYPVQSKMQLITDNQLKLPAIDILARAIVESAKKANINRTRPLMPSVISWALCCQPFKGSLLSDFTEKLVTESIVQDMGPALLQQKVQEGLQHLQERQNEAHKLEVTNRASRSSAVSPVSPSGIQMTQMSPPSDRSPRSPGSTGSSTRPVFPSIPSVSTMVTLCFVLAFVASSTSAHLLIAPDGSQVMSSSLSVHGNITTVDVVTGATRNLLQIIQQQQLMIQQQAQTVSAMNAVVQTLTSNVAQLQANLSNQSASIVSLQAKQAVLDAGLHWSSYTPTFISDGTTTASHTSTTSAGGGGAPVVLWYAVHGSTCYLQGDVEWGALVSGAVAVISY